MRKLLENILCIDKWKLVDIAREFLFPNIQVNLSATHSYESGGYSGSINSNSYNGSLSEINDGMSTSDVIYNNDEDDEDEATLNNISQLIAVLTEVHNLCKKIVDRFINEYGEIEVSNLGKIKKYFIAFSDTFTKGKFRYEQRLLKKEHN